jgi:endoribonuclease Dicer
MPYSRYTQDLSQLIEDCLLPISDADVALIDNSLQDPKGSCHNDLTATTLEAMLLLDKAVGAESEADKAVDLPSLSTSDDLESSEKGTSIATSIYNLSAFTPNSPPATMTPPLVDNLPSERPDLATMAPPTLQETLPLESITNTVASLQSVPFPTSTCQSEQTVKMVVPAALTNQSLPPATALATRKTDEVIADLKRPSTASHASPSTLKRRITSFASEAANPESTISDLPPVELYSATNGHINPEDDRSIEEDDGIESSDEEDVLLTAKPRKITERKRRQNAIADSYMQERTQRQLMEGNKLRAEDEAQQSMRYLVNQTENREIISSPREYQVELFEKAKEKNIIAVLDTGSYLLSGPHAPSEKSRFWQDFDCCPSSPTRLRPGIRRQGHGQAEADLVLSS